VEPAQRVRPRECGPPIKSDLGEVAEISRKTSGPDRLKSLRKWSTNLANWNASGASAGGTTVTFSAPVEIAAGPPALVEVTATVSGTPSAKVFTRLKVTQAP
jgi:hypothetical protein